MRRESSATPEYPCDERHIERYPSARFMLVRSGREKGEAASESFPIVTARLKLTQMEEGEVK
jgi:hypothetical protein